MRLCVGIILKFNVSHAKGHTLKNYKLQMSTSKFKEIRMLEDESFNDFYAKLNDIMNSRFNLGDKVEDERIVRKILT